MESGRCADASATESLKEYERHVEYPDLTVISKDSGSRFLTSKCVLATQSPVLANVLKLVSNGELSFVGDTDIAIETLLEHLHCSTSVLRGKSQTNAFTDGTGGKIKSLAEIAHKYDMKGECRGSLAVYFLKTLT